MGVLRYKFLMSILMYRDPFLASEMVLLMWILASKMETAGELGSPG